MFFDVSVNRFSQHQVRNAGVEPAFLTILLCIDQ